MVAFFAFLCTCKAELNHYKRPFRYLADIVTPQCSTNVKSTVDQARSEENYKVG